MSKKTAIDTAKSWMGRNPLFLDTETTGKEGQIVDIAVIDVKGTVLLQTLVKPAYKMEEDAFRVHGICEAMLVDSPSFEQVWNTRLRDLLRDRLFVAYNAAFDTNRILESAKNENKSPIQPMYDEVWDMIFKSPPPHETGSRCLMQLYSDFTSSWKWSKLQTAAFHLGVDFGEQTHRALDDAELARQVFLAMVNYDLEGKTNAVIESMQQKLFNIK